MLYGDIKLELGGEGGIRTRGRGFSPDNRLAGGPIQPLWHLPNFCQAEGEGFEPPVGVNPQLFSRQPP
jgi:hypothetical protein